MSPNTPPQQQSPAPRPESVRYLLRVWLAVAVAEVVHQVLQVAMSFMNRDVLTAALRKRLEDADDAPALSGSLVDLAASLSILGAATIYLVVLAVLLVLLRKLGQAHKWAGAARRVWFVFSVYFVFRMLMVFVATPAGSEAPDWLFAADGMVQIAIGAAAGMGVAFAMKESTLEYTGELEQMRRLEKSRREDRDQSDKKDRKQDQDKAGRP